MAASIAPDSSAPIRARSPKLWMVTWCTPMPSRASSEDSASAPGVPGALIPMVLPVRSASALTESFFAAGTRSATGGAAVRPKTSRGGALPA